MDSIPEKRRVVKWWENYVRIGFQGWEGKVGKRGVITEVSRQSRSRLRERLDNVWVELLPWRSLLRLSYPGVYPKDGRIVKRHLRMLGQRFKRMFPGFCGFWIIEFQRRGAPHFHLLTNVFVDHRVLAGWWYEVVGSGDAKHLRAGVRAEKPRSDMRDYFLKLYLAKGDQKRVPADFTNPGRFWGTWGNVGQQLGELDVEEAVALKVKRELRRCVEARLRRGRRLPEWVRQGKHRGVTLFRGGEKLAARLVMWATGEVKAGR